MKIKKFSVIFILLFIISCFSLNNFAYAYSEQIYLGGMPAGFSIIDRGAFINGVCEVVTDEGLISPAKVSGLRIGDIIYAINQNEVNSANEIENYIKNDEIYNLSVLREENIINIKIKPTKDINGKYRLGVLIRDKINGIGTITYLTKNQIGSLGHPVLNENGNLTKIISGSMYGCNITGAIKGEKGKPGELRGVFNKNNEIGRITKNSNTGIFASPLEIDYSSLTKINIGDAQMGDAEIYSTVQGCAPEKYNISIIKIDENNKSNKNFVIKITDKNLLERTGGIVQGMSGSPIIQNGKLVGAITHVFINDPTRGFGIMIDKMINN